MREGECKRGEYSPSGPGVSSLLIVYVLKKIIIVRSSLGKRSVQFELYQDINQL